MRLVVLTSDGDRHLYFAGELDRAIPLTALWVEPKSYRPEQAHQDAEGEAVLRRWFQGRDEAERSFFSAESLAARERLGSRTRLVPPGELNSETNVRLMEATAPDAVAVFGSSLLREPLIRAGRRVINMHLGLSPYYRGAGTNFWPFYNGEIEYVGVTIHWIDAGIDTGPIIRQGRPEIEPDDTPHTLGCKTIVTGVRLMVDVLRDAARGAAAGSPQRHDLGRLYRRADFAPEHVLRVEELVDNGLIRDYAERGPRELALVT